MRCRQEEGRQACPAEAGNDITTGYVTVNNRNTERVHATSSLRERNTSVRGLITTVVTQGKTFTVADAAYYVKPLR